MKLAINLYGDREKFEEAQLMQMVQLGGILSNSAQYLNLFGENSDTNNSTGRTNLDDIIGANALIRKYNSSAHQNLIN